MTIFVFGSNTQGRHGAGAALEARRNWGAIYGRAEGIQGRSYAIITKELRPQYPKISLYDVRQGVDKFLYFAELIEGIFPSIIFQVTKIGCGLAGFKEEEISPMFNSAPANCQLPDGWRATPYS